MFILPGIAGVVGLVLHGPIHQDPGYHGFADQRALWGIPHFGDVITNLPFVVAGVLGLWYVTAHARIGAEGAFREGRERLPYAVLFAALALTGFGSAYYHADPNNATLFWDRLPLTLVFMALFSIVITEHVSHSLGRVLFVPLLLVGASSILLWKWGEQDGVGQGDLRLYGMVQFYPMLAIPLILIMFRPLYSHGIYYWGVVAWYGAAKVAELLDHEIFALNGVLTGHNLKHVLAAAGCWWLVRMLQRRRPIESSNPNYS